MQEWAARVGSVVVHCEFGIELKIMLRNRFTIGFGKSPVMNRLFEENVNESTFEKADIINTSYHPISSKKQWMYIVSVTSPECAVHVRLGTETAAY